VLGKFEIKTVGIYVGTLGELIITALV